MNGYVYDPRPPDVAPGRLDRPGDRPGLWDPPGFTPGLWDRLLHVLLPAPCLACGTPLPARAPLGLCPPCHGRLRPLSPTNGARAVAPAGVGPVCSGCARPLAGLRSTAGSCCGRCLGAPPAYDRLLALWLYQPPLDAVVAGLKFGRLDYLGAHLAACAGDLCDLAAPAGLDLVVPVPLHWRRRLARGYNQSERIARPLARRLGVPYADALRRHRATPPQTALGRRARLANLHRAFRVRQPAAVAGRRILLVDDVATTGATLEAAARELRRAGALEILALVAGRTPDG